MEVVGKEGSQTQAQQSHQPTRGALVNMVGVVALLIGLLPQHQDHLCREMEEATESLEGGREGG